MIETCSTHGKVQRALTISGTHIKASCPHCNKYIKFISKDEVQPDEKILENKSIELF